MPTRPPLDPDLSLNLVSAVIASSSAPLLLLDDAFKVIAASQSFCNAFLGGASSPAGQVVFEMGAGEWNTARLRSLLTATASGHAEIGSYEVHLDIERVGTRQLALSAKKLDYGEGKAVRLMLTVVDMTDARLEAKIKDDLLREKAILLQELQHRVANSLQIISSVIMQSAMRAQSKEAKSHLEDAHNRVLSIAEVQRQLAASTLNEVALKPYFTQLCLSLGASMIRDHNQLTIEVDMNDGKVPADISISMGLIVTELVINALKHAFPDHRKGTIVVAYASRGPNWVLSVSDTGVGMPKDSASRTAGLGTSIVEALARQLEAHVDVADTGPGTAISIVHNQIAIVDSGAKPRSSTGPL